MSSSPRDEAQTIISHLAEIGPRRAGSPQEATVAAFINARLRHAGMGVTTLPLLATPRRRRLYLAAAAAGIFAALSAIVLPLPAIALALTAMVVLLIDAGGGPLMRLGRASRSQTIVGTQAISGESGQGPRAPSWRVVLLAPLDSPVGSSGLAALAGPAPAAAWARVVALALVALAALVDQIAPQRGWVLLVVPASILLALQIAAALRDPQPTPADGGIGALSAMLLSTQRLHQLEQVEIWAVAVGATSLDSGGVEELLNTYPFERERTLVIALEQITSGQLGYEVDAGAGCLEVDTLVTAAAEAIALPLGRGVAKEVGILTEPLRRRGMRTVTLYGRDDRGAAVVTRRASPQLCETAASLIVAIVARLDDAG